MEPRPKHISLLKRPRFGLSRPVFGALLVLLVGVLVFISIHMWQAWHTPDPAARTREVVAEVGRTMLVPQDDNATMATVTDAASLAKQQPFFKNAQNGDILLLFPSTGQAVLYRESKHLIINVGPVQAPPAGKSNGQ